MGVPRALRSSPALSATPATTFPRALPTTHPMRRMTIAPTSRGSAAIISEKAFPSQSSPARLDREPGYRRPLAVVRLVRACVLTGIAPVPERGSRRSLFLAAYRFRTLGRGESVFRARDPKSRHRVSYLSVGGERPDYTVKRGETDARLKLRRNKPTRDRPAVEKLTDAAVTDPT